MFTKIVVLPSALHKGRLNGRQGSKRMDIESVSGAKLWIHDKELKVTVTAENKISVDLAVRLIGKSNAHLDASLRKTGSCARCTVESDLLMAAFWTLKKVNKE